MSLNHDPMAGMMSADEACAPLGVEVVSVCPLGCSYNCYSARSSLQTSLLIQCKRSSVYLEDPELDAWKRLGAALGCVCDLLTCRHVLANE